MSNIVYVDLDTGEIKEEPFQYSGVADAGWGLAARLASTVRPSTEAGPAGGNCVVMAPGLLVGTHAPSTGRLPVAGRDLRKPGLHQANVGGPISQKMASSGIAALVVHGSYNPTRAAVVHVEEAGVSLHFLDELREKKVSDVLTNLRGRWGEHSAVIGIGPLGEHVLPLSSIFSTYPAGGKPVFHISRNKIGESFGSIGLKAVVASSQASFIAEVVDAEAMKEESRRLTEIITEHPVCGGALPAYGSITLMKMMSSGQDFSAALAAELDADGAHKHSPNNGSEHKVEKTGVRLNRSCAPRCAVACLNRHDAGDADAYGSPIESEIKAALEQLFAVTDLDFARLINRECSELGIDPMEFLSGCSMMLKAEGRSATTDAIVGLLDDVRHLSPRGRIAAANTDGIAQLYPDMPALQGLKTRPSVDEAPLFDLRIPNKDERFADLSDTDYLYGYMTSSSNLGLCLFTAFAILESPDGLETLARLVKAKTGVETSAEEVIRQGLACVENVRGYDRAFASNGSSLKIPEFVKVLYRYFNKSMSHA